MAIFVQGSVILNCHKAFWLKIYIIFRLQASGAEVLAMAELLHFRNSLFSTYRISCLR